MSMKINVMIADDQRLIRDGLKMLLELETDIEVVAEAANGQEVLDKFMQIAPDIVLMDVEMPVLNGVEATKALCKLSPEAKIIILTTFNKDEYVLQGIQAGAKGFLLKDSSGEEIAAAIRMVQQGKAMIDPVAATTLFAAMSQPQSAEDASTARQPQPLIEPLSEREVEILSLVADGMTNAQVAAQLHLADGTVKNYVSSIIQKMGVRDRTEAAVKARTSGLI